MGVVLVRTPRAFGALMYGWGQVLDWAALGIPWLLTFAIGIAIHFLPMMRLLDSLTDSRAAKGAVGKGGCSFDDGAPSSELMGEQYG
jgi:hypothetical protein